MTDTQNSTDLLPCPFCGGTPNLTHGDYVEDDMRPMTIVECRSCSAWVRVEHWNMRALPAEQQDEPFAFTTRGMLDIAKDMQKHEYGVGRIGARLERSDRFCIPLYLRPAAQAVKLPDVDQLSNIIRQVDGNHSLGAGALAEKIVEAVAGLNDYGRHGDEDMMVEE